jgi:ATP-dependent RNA helicase DeaD
MASYFKVVDLTSKPKSEQTASSLFKEPDPALPEASLDRLPPSMQTAVGRLGWSELMPVQSKAIPYMMAEGDLIVQSKTGSGKTGAFLLPLFERLDSSLRRPQAIILTPTRELARQIYETFVQASSPDAGLSAVSIYGGVSYGPQMKALKEGAQVVVGTPGRVLDHLARRTLSLKDLRVLILDEADEMLSVGFWPAMKELRRYLPMKRESYMFSATMPYKVQVLGEEFLHNPGFLSMGAVSVDRMRHRYTVSAPMDKNRTLVRFIELENPDSAIIFTNTKRRVEYLTLYLQQYGFKARGLSGDLSQKDREKIMEEIRSGSLRLLVATNVAARGIDISDVTHIWMYDIPQDPEYYVHRAGRTARAGKTGEVISLATITDEHVLKSISSKFGIEIDKVDEPSQDDVESHVSARVIELLEARLRKQSGEERLVSESFVPLVTQLMDEGHTVWLSSLFDEFYHETLHSIAPKPQTTAAKVTLPDMEALASNLEQRIGSLSNLEKDRLRRFETLVAQLIREGEPELPAMLLADFCALPTSPPRVKGHAKSRDKPSRQTRRKPRNRT